MRNDELQQFRGGLVDDLIGDRLKLLFVGINPGLWSAAVNAHFARPRNRFWPALAAAGITDHIFDASTGLASRDRQSLLTLGIGITNIVAFATARADELTQDELTLGGAALSERIRVLQPNVVAILGITAYRNAFGERKATLGTQLRRLGDVTTWVLPNPSGLNAHETVQSLGKTFRQVAEAANVQIAF
jgi:double-stranded uracil-DNA glycosylase